MIYAKTPKGHRVRVESEPVGTRNEQGRVYFGADGPKVATWTANTMAANIPRSLEQALEYADRQIEELGLVESDDEARDITLRFRVSATEQGMIQDAAREAGVTVSQYIRSRIL